MNETFEQGWAARPFKEQFPELSDKEAERLDKINAAITLLSMADILTFGQSDAIRQKKMPKVVSAAIAKARAAIAAASRENTGYAQHKNSQMIPAYIVCGKCKKHSEIDGNGGQMRCPHCGSTCMEHLEIRTGRKPSWFNESSTAIAAAKEI